MPQTRWTRLTLRQLCVRSVTAIMLVCSIVGGLTQATAQSINDQRPARIAAPLAPLVDINRASLAQLMRVHGITHSYAQRIIGGRPYANKGQLKTKGIIPEDVYLGAKNRLIAHHMK